MDHGKFNCFGHGAEVSGGLSHRERLVVGGDQHDHIRAAFLCVPGVLDSFRGAGGTGLSYHRHPPCSVLHDSFDHQAPFRVAEGREFTGGAAGHHAVDTFVNRSVHEESKLRNVDLAIVREGRRKGGEYSGELQCHRFSCLLLEAQTLDPKEKRVH